jgi:hypothetical protein
MIANQRFGVGFWTADDAVAFAVHEEHRTGIQHDVTEHPIHGTKRVIYDVAPAADSVRMEAA